MRSDLRNIIREVLAEELLSLDMKQMPHQVREERVTIQTNNDLASFVRRIMNLSSDVKTCADIKAGRYVFKIGNKSSSPISQTSSQSSACVTFDKGIITEKQIRGLPAGVAIVKVTNKVRFTPLAQDELRKIGIKVEREKI